MRTRIAMATVGVLCLAGPVAAQSAVPASDAGISAEHRPYEQRYLELRGEYVEEFGKRSAGRDIVRYGWLEEDGDVRQATREEVVTATERMQLALNPAEPAATPAATGSTATTYAASAAPTSVVECESGGDYGAVNPAGYYGAYQFDQQTWDAYAPSGYQGTNPAAAPPPVQDAAAANVPYDAWPNC